jgi:hypothetical protein
MTTSSLVAIVWLAVLLTVVGAFRLTTYLYRRDPLYAYITSATISFLFLTFFQMILLSVGILTLLLPVWYYFRGDGEQGLREDFRQRVAAGRQWFNQLVDNLDFLPNRDGQGNNVGICPACRRVFRHPGENCPDCGVELVNDLGGINHD